MANISHSNFYYGQQSAPSISTDSIVASRTNSTNVQIIQQILSVNLSGRLDNREIGYLSAEISQSCHHKTGYRRKKAPFSLLTSAATHIL